MQSLIRYTSMLKLTQYAKKKLPVLFCLYVPVNYPFLTFHFDRLFIFELSI